MFSITERSGEGFQKIILKDQESATYAELLPNCGGILHSFVVRHNGTAQNVIEQYDDELDFKKNAEAKGFKSIKLSPFVCRLKNGTYHFGETSHKIEKFYLGKHAIHGLLYDRKFTVTEKKSAEDSATVSLKYEYRKEDKGYPFDYDCIITYQLKKENTLTLTTHIINIDQGNIPMADGWHPYFTFGGSINDLQLEFQSKEQLEFTDELLPNGKLIPYKEYGSLKKIDDLFLDNCFTVNFAECQPMLVLRDTQKKLQLEVSPEKSYPYLQIYTPPHRQSIAVENLSAAPDAFNNGMGLITLAAGEESVFITTYKITSF